MECPGQSKVSKWTDRQTHLTSGNVGGSGEVTLVGAQTINSGWKEPYIYCTFILTGSGKTEKWKHSLIVEPSVAPLRHMLKHVLSQSQTTLNLRARVHSWRICVLLLWIKRHKKLTFLTCCSLKKLCTRLSHFCGNVHATTCLRVCPIWLDLSLFAPPRAWHKA